ncbi:ring-cleaving dioxygenase, partial [Halorubrum sp. SS5]
EERFGETVVPFRDPDGLPVELVAVEIPDDDPTTAWTAHVPESAAIRGFHSVTLWIDEPERTERLLRTMGLTEVESEADASTDGDRTRFAAGGPVGKYVDVVEVDQRGRSGRGTVHHVAFQTPTDDDQSGMRDAVASMGLRPTQQIDRHWFRSVYFREFAGVLFELATADPGYASDEPLDALGERLVLPGRFEERRDEIESGLADVTVPRADGEFAANRAD